MVSIMILGPSMWRRAKGQGRTPLQVRRDLSDVIESVTGNRPILLEDEPDQEGELHYEKFRRVVSERDVQTFVVYWPADARLNGLDIELGFLLNSIYDGVLDSSDVNLLIEKHILGISRNGTLELTESGNRTRYYQDLIHVGCRIQRWETSEELATAMVNVAMDHSAVMVGSDRRVKWADNPPVSDGKFHWLCGLCEKTSARSFSTWKGAHIDAMRHRGVLHEGREPVLLIAKRPDLPPAVPGPFVAACCVCEDILVGEYDNPDLADEALELHRRREHKAIPRVALMVLQKWTFEAHTDEMKTLLRKRQAGAKDEVDSWGGPRVVEL